MISNKIGFSSKNDIISYINRNSEQNSPAKLKQQGLTRVAEFSHAFSPDLSAKAVERSLEHDLRFAQEGRIGTFGDAMRRLPSTQVVVYREPKFVTEKDEVDGVSKSVVCKTEFWGRPLN